MAAGRCVYNEIVAEPLMTQNQEAWFVCVKTFLIARDLWEVVDGTEKPDEDPVSWRRKNAEALHIMQISCTPKSFFHIKRVSEAKAAWDLLNNVYSNRPIMPPQEPEEEEVDFDVVTLYNAIRKNNWCDAKAFLQKHPRALTTRLTSTDKTALHVAALFGHVGIVEELVKLVPQEYLEKVDDFGQTPLIIATYAGVTRVAECMVNKNRRILSIPNRLGALPVSLAFATGNKEMARYLYTVTPFEDLKSDKGPQGPRLLYYCFNAGDLDVALDLLQRCEELLFALDNNRWAPIKDIATMPSAFPSGSQLIFWKRWIYKCIHIQSTRTTNDVRVDIQQQHQSKRVRGT